MFPHWVNDHIIKLETCGHEWGEFMIIPPNQVPGFLHRAEVVMKQGQSWADFAAGASLQPDDRWMAEVNEFKGFNQLEIRS